MKILKFGGTSVGSANRIKKLVPLVKQNQSIIVVLSAISGTTNQLVLYSELITQERYEKALKCCEGLKSDYLELIEELYQNEKYKTKAKEIISHHFSFLNSFNFKPLNLFKEKNILAQGELLSTALFHYYLKECKIESVLLSALNFMRINENGEPNHSYLKKTLVNELKQFPEKKIFITQGFICRNAFGEIDNLKRGGSDYTATLIGAAIDAKENQIWTDIDGMHNNDPRIIDAGMTELIRPALYQANHKIINISSIKKETKKYDVVGPICESSDCFGKQINLPETQRGDCIIILSCGAYGQVMASQYNLRSHVRSYYYNTIS